MIVIQVLERGNAEYPEYPTHMNRLARTNDFYYDMKDIYEDLKKKAEEQRRHPLEVF